MGCSRPVLHGQATRLQQQGLPSVLDGSPIPLQLNCAQPPDGRRLGGHGGLSGPVRGLAQDLVQQLVAQAVLLRHRLEGRLRERLGCCCAGCACDGGQGPLEV
eukprot:5846589-Alexandrium_andersonii.AAC.1